LLNLAVVDDERHDFLADGWSQIGGRRRGRMVGLSMVTKLAEARLIPAVKFSSAIAVPCSYISEQWK
jgi:hypothetical protein